jgi:tRNA(Ile)-lysidine synthase
VREFLRQRGVIAYEDPANHDTRYARVRARLEILPALERDRPGIIRRFHAAAATAARLHESAVAQAAALLDSRPLRSVDLRQMPEAVSVEALKLLYTRAGGPEPGLSSSHLSSMLNLAAPGRGGRGVDLPGGLRFRIVWDLVQVVPSRAHGTMPVRQEPQLVISRCHGCDDRDAAHIRAGFSLHLGYRTPGLRLRPRGGPGTRKLQDIFVDARVPREDRDAWPLVFAGDRLAWVPGLALDSDVASGPGEDALHVIVSPMPVRFRPKVDRLEPPESPPGEPS